MTGAGLQKKREWKRRRSLDLKDMLHQEGYVVLQGLVPPAMCTLVATAIKLGGLKDEYDREGNIRPLRKYAYGTPTGDALALLISSTLESHLYPITPAFSYYRTYYKGAVLKMHTDRPSCEISVSLALSQNDWPLTVGDKDILLNKGDAVLYFGSGVVHGRPAPLEEEESDHVFLHYVKNGGEYDDFKFDRRAQLGSGEV